MVRAPLRVQMDLSRVNIEVSVTGPPAHYTRAGKVSTRTTPENDSAKKIHKRQGQQAVNN